MWVVNVVILIRGRERRSAWEESRAKGQFDSMCAAADVFFFFYSFQLKKKSHCAGHSGHILVKCCAHLLTRLWKQWGSVRRWRGWSFYLALCVCLDLLQSASSLLLQSVCFNPPFQKSASGHFWTTVAVLGLETLTQIAWKAAAAANFCQPPHSCF